MTSPEPNERETEIARGTCDLRDKQCQERTCGLCDAIASALARYRAEVVAAERERIACWWDDTEARAAEAHAVYQREAHRRGDVRHPDHYDDLSESTKEWDRVLVRWIAAAIRARGGKP